MQVTEHGDQSVNALTTQSVAHGTEQFRADAGAASDGHLGTQSIKTNYRVGHKKTVPYIILFKMLLHLFIRTK